MAKLVLIAEGTQKGLNTIGDLVSIHDDNVELSGAGYANFRVVNLPGITAETVETLISENTEIIENAMTKFQFNFSGLTDDEFLMVVSGTSKQRRTALKKIVRNN